MLAYSVIMFLGAGLFMAYGVAIYKGKIELIHDYHRARVRDRAAYGRAFGKALLCFAAAMLLSGVLGLLADTDTKAMGVAAVAVLIAGVAAGVGCLIAVQRKYNGGVF